ncbi:GNAT family N-acetyltransferase [Chelativorans sp. Marseille-P2723]|uniref:GNAT family N-acetyltransferase n=1 Tax=Chelativorans sp. Marseille-P2723 TaxID=2709133 RepID=UPI0015713B01|nr:GNAT family N-acetyltransferase [Chelativorans sp. Marseille-P2723]
MSIELEIRPYQPNDKPRLLEIWRQASIVGHPFFTEQQLDEQAKAVAAIYLPRAENWVATCNELPVGFIGLLDGFIGGLFVDPAFHAQGIGRALVEHAARLKGRLELEVYSLNKGASRFYKRLGFREVSRRDIDDNGLPFELLRLER